MPVPAHCAPGQTCGGWRLGFVQRREAERYVRSPAVRSSHPRRRSSSTTRSAVAVIEALEEVVPRHPRTRVSGCSRTRSSGHVTTPGAKEKDAGPPVLFTDHGAGSLGCMRARADHRRADRRACVAGSRRAPCHPEFAGGHRVPYIRWSGRRNRCDVPEAEWHFIARGAGLVATRWRADCG